MFQHLRSYFPKEGVTLPEIIGNFGSSSSSVPEGEQGTSRESKFTKFRTELTKHWSSVLIHSSGTNNTTSKDESPELSDYLVYNTDGGLVLARKYETEWNNIKTRNSENARLASAADKLIIEACTRCQEHFDTCEQLKKELNHLPEIQVMLGELKGTIVNLRRKAELIDSKYSTILEKAEETEFKEWRASKIREFETYRNEQKSRYADKKAMLEAQLEKTLRDNMLRKRTTYERNFEQQMEMYRKNSEISINSPTSRTSSIASVPSLESLVLEDNQDELNAFLGDISDEENASIDQSLSDSKEEENNILVIPDEDYVDDDF